MEIIINPERRDWTRLTERATSGNDAIAERVDEIIRRVKTLGDSALMELTLKIDGVRLPSLNVTPNEIDEAVQRVSKELREAMQTAADNIYKFHKAQLSEPIDIETSPSVRCIQRSVPIQRVGLYIPAGSAPLFSTVLMLATPARVAGCKEVILCTPPDKSGSVADEILCAAKICGVSKIYKVGGAQAIAAMAYGTLTIPAVDKIFGPGNRYVTRAKQIVAAEKCAIDMPAGPSEVMVLADDSARAEFVAADMLSQAEHGGDSQSILVTCSRAFAEIVTKSVEEQLKKLSRRDTAQKSLDNSRIIVMDSAQDMIDFANCYAAEHLIISMENPWDVAEQITAAGSVFIGNYSPESAGDYASGTNHTLPTAGWARSMSGVNTDSFMRKITYQELTQQGLENLAPTIIAMAEGEGLDAHAAAVKIRVGQ